MKITPETLKMVLNQIAAGRTLTSICVGDDMPTPEAVIMLARRDPDFGEQYRFARECGAELRGDRLIDKGESAIGLDSMARVQGIKVSTEVDKWHMARMYPQLWGDRVTMEHTGKTIWLPVGHPDGHPEGQDDRNSGFEWFDFPS